MFGFIVGTACLVGFIVVYKRGRRHGFAGFAPRWMFRKLDTSPAQERIVRNAVDTVRAEARRFADQSREARRDLADLLRAPDYDRERVRDWFAARETDFQQVRESVVGALGDVFDVLDDQQREKFAKMIEKSHYGHRVCHHRSGPYRSQGAET